MSDDIEINEHALLASGAYFVQASSTMMSGNATRPRVGVESLTGIGSAVALHLEVMDLARAALADAARTGGESVSALMAESSELDRFIAQELGVGFAVQEGLE
ncbi:MAG: hypothetical protein ACNYNX_00385 [Leucobacter sp.]